LSVGSVAAEGNPEDQKRSSKSKITGNGNGNGNGNGKRRACSDA